MRRRLLAAALAVGALIVFAPAALAAHDPDRKGWFIDLGGAGVTPGNVNTPILFSAPADGALSGGSGDFASEVEWMDFDSDFAFRVGGGYSWGKQGALQVSYWEYSDTGSSDGFSDSYYYGSGDNYNWFGVGPTAAFGYSFYYPVEWDFEQEIEARTVDVEYTRTHQMNSPLVLTWGVGLRFAEFDEDVTGEYLVDPGVGNYRFPAERNLDGDGWGFTGSVGAGYDFNDYFGLATNLRVGFINSDVDATHEITDVDGYYAAAGATWSEEASVEDEVANTVDFDFDLTFHLMEHLDIDVGYGYTTWTDLPTSPLSRALFGTDDQAGFVIPGENRDRISFSGPRLRFKIKF